jgi:hypothetical protein
MNTILSSESPPSPAPEEILPSGNLPVLVLNGAMTNRHRRFLAAIRHAMLDHGLLALLLPLGLLFLALVAHG